MMLGPKTKAEAAKYRYGVWPGCKHGRAHNPKRCAAAIADGWLFRQCGRTCGHGPDGLYCKQHAKQVEP